MKLRWIFVGCVSIAIAYLFWQADPFYMKAPKDRELLNIFQENRAIFIKLQKMAEHDKVLYISSTDINGDVSDVRKKQYISLIKKIDSTIIITKSSTTVRFSFASGGLLSVGPEWIKGLEYVSNPSKEGTIKKTLDNPSELPDGDVYLREIESNWYLFFQKTS